MWIPIIKLQNKNHKKERVDLHLINVSSVCLFKSKCLQRSIEGSNSVHFFIEDEVSV